MYIGEKYQGDIGSDYCVHIQYKYVSHYVLWNLGTLLPINGEGAKNKNPEVNYKMALIVLFVVEIIYLESQCSEPQVLG